MENSQPATFRHATSLYAALKEKSETEKVRGEKAQIFTGSITEVFKSLEISQSYYSPVTRSLVANGCYEVVVKGARGQPTTLVLREAPDPDTFRVVRDRSKLDIPVVAQRLDNIERNIGGINIPIALVDMNRELQKLRRELYDLRDEVKAGGKEIAT